MEQGKKKRGGDIRAVLRTLLQTIFTVGKTFILKRNGEHLIFPLVLIPKWFVI